MYISKIELKGFKSFANKTQVILSSGITGVVGPNGCGKSNIVDALRWVLGEQRASQLRSSAMASVIFNGTKNRKKAGFAEVSLTIDNNKGILPSEFEQVKLTRRLYRSGQSEYLLNGTACRLKDIHALFVDTGLNTNAYSVIELKAVEGIVDDKNNERRKLFEEAAGVTRYKEQRRDTHKKLKETKEDLQRLSDILLIMQKKVKSLESQSKKARRLKELQHELLHLDQAAAVFEHKKLESELEPLTQQQKQAEEEKTQLQKQLEQAEKHLLASRESSAKQLDAEDEAQKTFIQLQEVYNSAQTEYKLCEQQLETELSKVANFQQEVISEGARLEEVSELLKHASTKKEELHSAFQKADNQQNAISERYEEVLGRFNEMRRIAESASRQEKTLQAALLSKREASIKLQSKLENEEENNRRLQRDNIQWNEQLATLQTEIEAATLESDKAKAVYEEIEKTHEEQEELLKAKDAKLEEQRELVATTKTELSTAISEVNTLKHLASSAAYSPENLKKLLKIAQKEGLTSFKPLIDYIEVQDDFAAHLELALGEAANALVIHTSEEAQKLIDLADKHKLGRIPYLLTNLVRTHAEVLPDSLFHRVSGNEPVLATLQQLLAKVQVIDANDHLDHWFEKGAELLIDQHLGMYHRSGLRYQGKVGDQIGQRVLLAKRLEEAESRHEALKTKVEQEQVVLEDIKHAKKQLHAELQQINQDEVEKRKNWQKAKEQLDRLYFKRDNVQNSLDKASDSSETHQNQIAALQNQLQEAKQQEIMAQNEYEVFEQQGSNRGHELQILEEEKNLAQRQLNEIRLNRQDLANQVANLEREVERSQLTKERLEQAIAQKKTAMIRAKEMESDLGSRIEKARIAVEEGRLQVNQAAEALKTVKEENASLRGAIRQLEEEVRDVQRKKEVNTDLIHHLDMARQNLQSQLKQLSERVWEDYGKLIRQLEVSIPEDFQLEAARQRLKNIRQQIQNIGQVNELAIQEYEEEKEKLDFYLQQIEDLQEAEKDLLQSLDEINRTAVDRFNTTFEQIRTNFQQVFKTLFNEDDECDLIIDEQAEDVLEAAIKIIARPKGKRPSNISQLSGGEKTLTATALLFAIYLVKPSPFCVLDEVDAPLDDANIERFANMIKRFSTDTQFIIVTHNKNTMANAGRLYGVTMVESGISQLVAVDVTGLEVNQ